MKYALLGILIYFLIVGVVLGLQWRTRKRSELHRHKQWDLFRQSLRGRPILYKEKELLRQKAQMVLKNNGKIYNSHVLAKINRNINRDISRLSNRRRREGQ